MIREWRNKKEWTQSQLAEQIGCTDGFIALLEKEKRLPSADICTALARVFELTPEEQQKLFEAVRNQRRQLFEERDSTRAFHRSASSQGETMTTTLRTTTENIDAESIASDLDSDPALKTAYLDLKISLANPQQRETVLKVIRAIAEQAARQGS
jgi:transcriptional regulator with XRE-family HTH domain